MKNDEMIILMSIFQMINFYIMFFHKDKELFLRQKAGHLFLILPALVILVCVGGLCNGNLAR
jgi:hypothetical protein